MKSLAFIAVLLGALYCLNNPAILDRLIGPAGPDAVTPTVAADTGLFYAGVFDAAAEELEGLPELKTWAQVGGYLIRLGAAANAAEPAKADVSALFTAHFGTLPTQGEVTPDGRRKLVAACRAMADECEAKR